MNDVWEIYGMRRFLKLSQHKFAEQIGCSRSTVNDIENLRRNPSDSFLISFNRVFMPLKTREFYIFLEDLKKIVNKYPI